MKKNESNVYVIAEVGQAHDGSLGILHSYIDAVAKTGANAVKFQTHIAEAESSMHEPFRVKFSYVDKTRFDYWKRMSFSEEQWIEIAKHCREVGLDFVSSPFSIEAVNLLEKVGVDKYKIGSGEVTNLLLLEQVARTGKPIIISSGMSDYKELDKAISHISKFNSNISVLQCTTQYPVKPEKLGLNVIVELKERYSLPVGLSDHSSTIFPSIVAVSMGAKIIEAHIVFDKSMFGPDSSSSLTVAEFTQLVDGVRFIDTAYNSPVDKAKNDDFTDVKRIFEKSLSVNRDLAKGSIITVDMLETKKPSGFGISADRYQEIIGKKIKTDMAKWDFLNWEDIK